MLTVLGGLADFERDLIRARTGEGRKRAQERRQVRLAAEAHPHINGRRLLLGYARSVQGTDFTVSASVPEGNRPAELFSMWSILTVPIGFPPLNSAWISPPQGPCDVGMGLA
jgi:hypothetical protein